MSLHARVLFVTRPTTRRLIPSHINVIRFIRSGWKRPINANFGAPSQVRDAEPEGSFVDELEDAFEDFRRNTEGGELLEGAEKLHRKFIKRKILEQKYDKPPQSLNILTWAAKEQIRHLNQIDPTDWTPNKLADSFKVTPEDIIKIVKSSFKLKTWKEVAKHDATVFRNCKLMKLEGGPILPQTVPSDGKIDLSAPTLTISSDRAVDRTKQSHVVGPFQSIYVQYQERLEQKKNHAGRKSETAEARVEEIDGLNGNHKKVFCDEPKGKELLEEFSQLNTKDNSSYDNVNIESTDTESYESVTEVRPVSGKEPEIVSVSNIEDGATKGMSRRAWRKKQKELETEGTATENKPHTDLRNEDFVLQGKEVNVTESNIDVLKMLETMKINQREGTPTTTNDRSSYGPNTAVSPELDDDGDDDDETRFAQRKNGRQGIDHQNEYRHVKQSRNQRIEPINRTQQPQYVKGEKIRLDEEVSETVVSPSRYHKLGKFNSKDKEVYDEDGEILYRVP